MRSEQDRRQLAGMCHVHLSRESKSLTTALRGCRSAVCHHNAAGLAVHSAMSLYTAVTGRALVLQSATKHARATSKNSHSILPYSSAAAFLLAAGCAIDSPAIHQAPRQHHVGMPAGFHHSRLKQQTLGLLECLCRQPARTSTACVQGSQQGLLEQPTWS